MKLVLSALLLATAALCLSCGSDEPPPQQTIIRETRYVPVTPKRPPPPRGPEAFEPVNRY